MNSAQQLELAALIDKYSNGDGLHQTAIPKLVFAKSTENTLPNCVLYEAALCLIVQGSKKAMLEEDIYRYNSGKFLVVSVDLPVRGQVVEASKEKPYLALAMSLDAGQLSELITQTGKKISSNENTRRGLLVEESDDVLTDSILRLVRLLDTQHDIPLLAPMMMREIYYRLLNGPYGDTIAQIALSGSNMQKISKVISMIKTNYNQPIKIEEMAGLANMSPSSFHSHFKAVTAMSPLQYQKRIRLMEARRLMLTEVQDAATASYRVGYESPSQFSREYSRMFGAPPMSDIESLRSSAMAKAN